MYLESALVILINDLLDVADKGGGEPIDHNHFKSDNSMILVECSFSCGLN